MLLKQPGKGNVVTQRYASGCKKDDLSEMPGFLSGGLTILISGEASMLSTSIMKMFHL